MCVCVCVCVLLCVLGSGQVSTLPGLCVSRCHNWYASTFTPVQGGLQMQKRLLCSTNSRKLTQSTDTGFVGQIDQLVWLADT